MELIFVYYLKDYLFCILLLTKKQELFTIYTGINVVNKR